MDLDGRRLVNPRLVIFAAISLTFAGVAISNMIPSDQSPPLLPVARTVRFDLKPPGNRQPDPRPNSPVPRKAATIFVSLAAQLRGGENAEVEVDGEDGWRFHDTRVHYLDPQQVPAGVPIFLRITYWGTSWGDHPEARTIKCSSILTFAVNRRYNLWCGEKDDVVVTLLEETR